MKLKDEVAIITGGGRGIGKTVAEGFAREGAYVVIASEIEDELAQASTELGVDHFQTDVTRTGEVKRLIKPTLSRYGKIDILIK